MLSAVVNNNTMSSLPTLAPLNCESSSNASSSTSSSSSSTKRTKLYVQHDYSDHSDDPIYDETSCHDMIGSKSIKCGSLEKTVLTLRRGPRGGVIDPFPTKLHQMLSKSDEEGFSHIVSWQPHGRCFVIHDPKKFVSEIMPRFFKQSKFTSFQRQVNLYGFRRLTKGVDRGGYYHELFLRGRFDLSKRIIRIRIKGTGAKPAYSPQTEPNFYAMKPCCRQSNVTKPTSSTESCKVENPMIETKMALPSTHLPQRREMTPSPIYSSTNYPVKQKVAKWGQNPVMHQPSLASMAQSMFAQPTAAAPLQSPPTLPSNNDVITTPRPVIHNTFNSQPIPIKPNPVQTPSALDMMLDNLDILDDCIDPGMWNESSASVSNSNTKQSSASTSAVGVNPDDEEFFDKLTFHYLDVLGDALDGAVDF